MKKFIVVFIAIFFAQFLHAQQPAENADTSWKSIDRTPAVRINDLVHTKLQVRFDYDKSWLQGKAWITLQPHEHPTDSLSLDAKGMTINSIVLISGSKKTPAQFDYDGMNLKIILNKTYQPGEKYTALIEYISKPNDLKQKGSAAITSAKGLYFINPKGENRNEPTEIWTQGETESNSAWFPTIDKPNQKSTEEIYINTPDQYVTLSNGTLKSKTKNKDGTRTDYWKMDQPHAPYLFFMGVGDYAVIHDRYKNKPVDYYVEREYAPVAGRIFGETPAMMKFYSDLLGVDFPWPKYDQMTAREYVSGAMENTTATLHSSDAQQDVRELTDGNRWEDVIAHELFHQWFGDLVTAESWSNLTLNESFADYSETLWEAHRHGRDAGDATNFRGLQVYLYNPANESKDLVRYHYADREDMFDGVSYAKGGRVLHMLRSLCGDSLFFQSLHLYLTTNKYKSASASQLELAFEQTTHQDLKWFWNQWYYGSGHPKLDINYNYNDSLKTARVIITQTQSTGKIFRLPTTIDVYTNGHKNTYPFTIGNKSDTFTFSCARRPELINVDGDKVLLCEKEDHKTLDNYIYQYVNAGLYLDRREAVEFAVAHQDDPKAINFLANLAMHDPFAGLRMYTMDNLKLESENARHIFEPRIADMAANDPDKKARAKAIQLLGQYKNISYKSLFENALTDSSYSVSGNALDALAAIDFSAAKNETLLLASQPARGQLAESITKILIRSHDTTHFDLIVANFEKMNDLQQKLNMLQDLSAMLINTRNPARFKKGVDMLVAFRDNFPGPQHDQMAGFMNNSILSQIKNQKERAGFKEDANYIRGLMPIY